AGLSGLKVAASAEAACAGADCLILLTEWREFQMLDWENIGETMTARNIVDARNLLSPESMRRAGFTYTSVGQY
ncbi:MAG TPA: UDP binding domain-containing protein, partial [candidate division Zixibacteria bacterium]|nr:UDP binding domain-containing protein [candidate division Zixibacteria bacterium]